MKPLLFAQALEQRTIDPSTILDDLEPGPGGILNSDERFLGPMLPRVALANSRNVPAVALLSRIGLDTFYGLLGDLRLHRHEQPARRYGLGLAIGALPHEVFSVLFLDSQHRLLKHDEMFRGTLSQTSVYPREVVRRALELNSAAVIFAHNHPSGAAEPSRADEFLTQSLKSALQLVDVRVLDHLVVGRGAVVSFAERGLL